MTWGSSPLLEAPGRAARDPHETTSRRAASGSWTKAGSAAWWRPGAVSTTTVGRSPPRDRIAMGGGHATRSLRSSRPLRDEREAFRRGVIPRRAIVRAVRPWQSGPGGDRGRGPPALRRACGRDPGRGATSPGRCEGPALAVGGTDEGGDARDGRSAAWVGAPSDGAVFAGRERPGAEDLPHLGSGRAAAGMPPDRACRDQADAPVSTRCPGADAGPPAGPRSRARSAPQIALPLSARWPAAHGSRRRCGFAPAERGRDPSRIGDRPGRHARPAPRPGRLRARTPPLLGIADPNSHEPSEPRSTRSSACFAC